MSDYTEVNYSLKQVPAQKPVNGLQFPQGTIDFPFSIGAPNCWNPHRSYFKIDYQLVGIGTLAGAQPEVGDMMSMAYNFAGNLFTQVNCKFGEQDVSVINTLAPQASALKTRLRRSASWLHNVGKSVNYNTASNASRLYQGSYGSLNDRGDGATQFIFKGAPNANIGTVAATYAKVSVDSTGVVTGSNGCAFTTPSGPLGDTLVQAGDILVVNGLRFTVDTSLNPIAPTTFNVIPPPGANIPATTEYYFIRQNFENTNINKNVSSVLWQPPCGLFDCDEWIGSGQYRISLVPNSNYIQSVVQTPNQNYNSKPNGWEFSVQAVYFYAYCAKASIPEGPRELPLIELAVTSKPYLGSNTFQFIVPPSTFAISVFAQNNIAGSSNLWPPSLFKALPTSFAQSQSGDVSLQNIQVTYASINKPDTNWNSNYNASQDGLSLNPTQVGQVNQLIQRYYDTFLENKTEDSIGGSESLDEWLQNGPVMHFLFSRDVTDRSTEVNLNITYSNLDNATSNIVLVAWYRNIVNYTVAQGLITAVASRPA